MKFGVQLHNYMCHIYAKGFFFKIQTFIKWLLTKCQFPKLVHTKIIIITSLKWAMSLKVK